MRTATASVSALMLYGSCAALKYPASSGCTARTPTRSPAAARTFENVFETTRFGLRSICGTSVVPAKSAYASSTSTTLSG